MLKEKENLVKNLPNLVDYLTFFKDGTVVQTSFKHPMNIPKMSENLLHICQDFQQFEEACHYEKEPMVRHLFETAKLNSCGSADFSISTIRALTDL